MTKHILTMAGIIGCLVSSVAAQQPCTIQLDVAAAAAAAGDKFDDILAWEEVVDAGFGIAAPLMTEGFTIDGIAGENEYTQANTCSIVYHDRENPGYPLPALDQLEGEEEDLSVTLHYGHTDKALYMAYEVTDDFLDLQPGGNAFTDDSVEVFYNADGADQGRGWDLTGFQIVANAVAGEFEEDFIEDGVTLDGADLSIEWNDRFSAGGPVQPALSPEDVDLDGTEYGSAGLPIPGTSNYVVEFVLPLTAMTNDPDGLEDPPKTGDVLAHNFVINDNDVQGAGGQDTHAMLWLVEDDPRSPWSGAQQTWPVPVQLTEAAAVTPGDLNGDGECDDKDIDALAEAIRNGEMGAKYDIDGNGSVNSDDHSAYVKTVKKTWIGDSDLDGEFNSGDFVKVFQAGAYETGNAATWSQGDFNGDGLFDSGDLVTAFQDGGFEQGVLPDGGVATVPEPASALLSLFALGALLSFRRRR